MDSQTNPSATASQLHAQWLDLQSRLEATTGDTDDPDALERFRDGLFDLQNSIVLKLSKTGAEAMLDVLRKLDLWCRSKNYTCETSTGLDDDNDSLVLSAIVDLGRIVDSPVCCNLVEHVQYNRKQAA
ncbi:MAG: hypothetical protein AAGI03_13050 [Pseudomonadota bacterium]